MIDPTMLRGRMQAQRSLLPGAVCIDVSVAELESLLDENAALRAKLEECAADGIRVAFKLSEAESRLAALTAAGEKVMKMNAPTPCSGCEMCRAWDAFKAELRSDP